MELDKDAQRILELTREARTPSAADKDRVAGRLASGLPLGAMSAHAGTSVIPKAVGTTWFAKWAGIAVVAAVSGAGYFAFRATPRSVPVAASIESPPPPITAREKAVVDPAIAPAPPPSPREIIAPRDDDAPRPRATVKSPAPRATLSDELDLLHDAQAKWRSGNPSAALAAIAEHRARFPHSALEPERDALAVLSLCAMNRVTEAKRLARHFLATAPHSPLKASVEESCAGK